MLVMGEYVGFLCVKYYSGVCLVVLKGDDGSVMVFFGWGLLFWLGCVGVGDAFLFFGV